MNQLCEKSTDELHPPLKDLDDAIVILNAMQSLSKRLNDQVGGDPITAEELVVALESTIAQNVIWHQIAIMRDDDTFEDKFHGE